MAVTFSGALQSLKILKFIDLVDFRQCDFYLSVCMIFATFSFYIEITSFIQNWDVALAIL